MQQNYNDTCSFCLGNLKTENSKITLDCGHIYHNICWNQYQKKSCPLCRQKSSIKNKEIKHSNIKIYEDDTFVWIFGSFIPFVPFTNSKRKNTVLLTNGTKKFISGFFWRLFDDEISKELETQYQEYIKDNSKNEFMMDIGTMNYNIMYNNVNADFSNTNIEPKICIQKNQSGKYRPILRIKWKDVVDNLLVIGIHDIAFFEYIYIYCDNDNNIYLFDMNNQEKINNLYKNKQNYEEIKIGNHFFKLDIIENNIVNDDNKIIYNIGIFDKQNVCNY
jgi:hypothetical protein